MSQTDPVPAVYRPLYDEMSGYVSDMESSVADRWDGTKKPVSFGANLLSANTGRGPSLLNKTAPYGILMEAARLRRLGVTLVHIGAGYPTLLPRYSADSQRYIDLYRFLIPELRKMGLKVAISTGPEPDLPYYRTLTLDEYIRGRVDVMVVIAQFIHPDYLIMVNEPDIETAACGHDMNNVASQTRMLRDGLAAVASARAGGMQAGA